MKKLSLFLIFLFTTPTWSLGLKNKSNILHLDLSPILIEAGFNGSIELAYRRCLIAGFCPGLQIKYESNVIYVRNPTHTFYYGIALPYYINIINDVFALIELTADSGISTSENFGAEILNTNPITARKSDFYLEHKLIIGVHFYFTSDWFIQLIGFNKAETVFSRGAIIRKYQPGIGFRLGSQF